MLKFIVLEDLIIEYSDVSSLDTLVIKKKCKTGGFDPRYPSSLLTNTYLFDTENYNWIVMNATVHEGKYVSVILLVQLTYGYKHVFIDFTNNTAKFVKADFKPINDDDEYEKQYDITSKKKMKRISKIDVRLEDSDIDILIDKNIVIDYVDKKYYEIDQIYVINGIDYDDTIEYLEERFFRESCMMTYDYSGRISSDKYVFVTVKGDRDGEEE